MSDNKVSIKQRIDDVMQEEFEKLLSKSDLSPLLRMVINNKIDPYHTKLEELMENLKKEDHEVD